MGQAGRKSYIKTVFHAVQMQFSLCTLFSCVCASQILNGYVYGIWTEVFEWSKTKSIEVDISGVKKSGSKILWI